MKKMIYTVAFIFASISCYSQPTRIIDSLKQLQPIDFSERPIINASRLVVVTDGKIQAPGSKEYKALKKADIISTQSIRDTTLIISTKGKNKK